MVLRVSIFLKLLFFLLAGISPANGSLLTTSESRTDGTGAKTTNRTYDRQGRLTTLNGQNVSNDADGNMTHAPVSATVWKNFQYDSRNRLTAVGTPQEWENVFDAEGHRVEYRNAGVPTKFVVSPGTLPKTLVQINDDGTRRYFIHGLGLLYHIDDEEIAAPVTTTYHYNAQGSTIALSNDGGSSVGRFHYDPYGLVQRKEGITDTIFQFNGHYGIATDPNGLVHLNARFYNPYLKRFMNSDPAGFAGGMNWFAYSAGDPINLMDPLGLGPADSERYTWMDGVQDGIGTLGFIPGAGAIPDGVNGVIYLFRGRLGDAGFSFAAMIPFAGDAVAAARYADRLNDVRRIADEAGDIPRVFWSGGDSAREAAEAYAKANGGTTLEMTAVGQRLQETTKGLDWFSEAKPMWEAASADFARGAKGPVHVFQNGGRGVSLESVWRGTEFPILMQQGNPLNYHVVMPSGVVPVR